MGRSPALIALGTLAWLLSSACYGPPRPQLLVEVTTDLATPADVAADPSILGTATIDHVRAEVLADDGTTLTAKDFAIASGAEFPVSFGIEATEGAPLLVRVTGYRSTLAVAHDTTGLPLPSLRSRGSCGRALETTR